MDRAAVLRQRDRRWADVLIVGGDVYQLMVFRQLPAGDVVVDHVARRQAVERNRRDVDHPDRQVVQVQLDMYRLASFAHAEKSPGLVEIIVVELAAKAGPGVLRFPCQHAGVNVPHIPGVAFEHRAVLHVVDDLGAQREIGRRLRLAISGDLVLLPIRIRDVFVRLPHWPPTRFPDREGPRLERGGRQEALQGLYVWRTDRTDLRVEWVLCELGLGRVEGRGREYTVWPVVRPQSVGKRRP